jgi:hypothetical protein
MNEWKNYFFKFSGNVEPTLEWYWQGKTEGLWEKPVPVPLCPQQILHGLTWERTRPAATHITKMNFNCWKDWFSIVDSEKKGNLFLNSLPSGLLRLRGLLNRLNHLASFMKLVSACAYRNEKTNTHIYKYKWRLSYKITPHCSKSTSLRLGTTVGLQAYIK